MLSGGRVGKSEKSSSNKGLLPCAFFLLSLRSAFLGGILKFYYKIVIISIDLSEFKFSKIEEKMPPQSQNTVTSSDMTLNQKINKVIAEIKQLNKEKAEKFGCYISTYNPNNTTGNNPKSHTNSHHKSSI